MPYRYFIGNRLIRKLSLSGFIGIGRYEKKLIGRTLNQIVQFIAIGKIKDNIYQSQIHSKKYQGQKILIAS